MINIHIEGELEVELKTCIPEPLSVLRALAMIWWRTLSSWPVTEKKGEFNSVIVP